MSKVTGFKKHRPVDASDPGFTIPGYKLRWISGKVEENSPGRPWVVLRKENLPKELVDHLESHRPDIFAHNATIRRGDLALAYAPTDIATALKKEKAELAREQADRVKRTEHLPDRSGGSRLTVEVNEDQEVDAAALERFKEKRGA